MSRLALMLALSGTAGLLALLAEPAAAQGRGRPSQSVPPGHRPPPAP